MSFITFEGIEGSGKSTQARRLAAFLPDSLLTREPGGTAIGRSIRAVLLDRGNQNLALTTEALLFFADRAQHVEEVIRPALTAGRTVISDRYVDSSYAYQGYGRHRVGPQLLRSMADLATGGLTPDLTVLLDVPVEIGLGRVGNRGIHDRFESEAREFHEGVRRGYLALADLEPQRWLVMDGARPADEIAARILSTVEAHGLIVARNHGIR